MSQRSLYSGTQSARQTPARNSAHSPGHTPQPILNSYLKSEGRFRVSSHGVCTENLQGSTESLTRSGKDLHRIRLEIKPAIKFYRGRTSVGNAVDKRKNPLLHILHKKSTTEKSTANPHQIGAENLRSI